MGNEEQEKSINDINRKNDENINENQEKIDCDNDTNEKIKKDTDYLRLEEELNNKIVEAKENYKLSQRIQADFENYKRRVERERESYRISATEEMIDNLLPIIDDLERAVSTAKNKDNEESIIKGVEMVLNKLKKCLNEQGLKEIKALGEPFDPEYHEAVLQVEDDSYEENTVVEVMRKGYLLNSRVIRPSMVKVAK